ncbi:hypothetical protein [Mahella australiensis]|uniref:Uncharacterized protein n=1 Tax=Mahella australiensis (strain DSM 15567 / CIP 107919 / 50-1 BON) TaxID=697281 RepID=F3ZZL8_MAHA5|nr:hypothetical protein [Mahella australiensis]AEE96844.1 hypothetical protein Mahau_1663 [Mahella australiensis 50-1 BON]
MDRVTRSRIRKKQRRCFIIGTMLCLFVFIGGFIIADLSLAAMNNREAGSAVVFDNISQQLQDARIWDRLSGILDALWQHITSAQ